MKLEWPDWGLTRRGGGRADRVLLGKAPDRGVGSSLSQDCATWASVCQAFGNGFLAWAFQIAGSLALWLLFGSAMRKEGLDSL